MIFKMINLSSFKYVNETAENTQMHLLHVDILTTGRPIDKLSKNLDGVNIFCKKQKNKKCTPMWIVLGLSSVH